MSKLTPEDVVLRYSKRGMNILKKYLMAIAGPQQKSFFTQSVEPFF